MDSRRVFGGSDARSVEAAVSRRPCYDRVPEGCHGEAGRADPGSPSCCRDRDQGGPTVPLCRGGEEDAGCDLQCWRQSVQRRGSLHASSAYQRPHPRPAARTHGAAVITLLLFSGLVGLHSAEALLGQGAFSAPGQLGEVRRGSRIWREGRPNAVRVVGVLPQSCKRC